MSNFKINTIKGLVLAIILSFGSMTNAIATNTFIEDTSEIRTKYTKEQVMLDKSPIMEDYIAQSRRKIKNNWYPPTSSFENTATIVVKLDKNGKLLNCSLSQPSPDDGFNNSLIKAVKKTKFSPLPDEFSEDSVDIDFTFNMQKRGIIGQ